MWSDQLLELTWAPMVLSGLHVMVVHNSWEIVIPPLWLVAVSDRSFATAGPRLSSSLGKNKCTSS